MSEETIIKNWEQHPMLKPKIEKVVVNLNVGKSGEPLEKANKVLKEITGQTQLKEKPKKQSVTSVYVKVNQSQSSLPCVNKKPSISLRKSCQSSTTNLQHELSTSAETLALVSKNTLKFQASNMTLKLAYSAWMSASPSIVLVKA